MAIILWNDVPLKIMYTIEILYIILSGEQCCVFYHVNSYQWVGDTITYINNL